jgi:uncharacterized protein (TIGR02996 family)
MSHDDAFLASIIESPDDDTPRLVYADWLEEHGQGERAEFIRVQCELATMAEGDPRRAELGARERQLLQWHEETWVGPLCPLARSWVFRRGFIDEVWTTARAFSTYAARLFRSAPLRHVHVARAAGRVGDVTACALVHRLTSLYLDAAGLTDRDAWVLARSPYVSGLSVLCLHNNRITSRGVQALAESPHLTRLADLDLGCNPITVAGVQALVAPSCLTGLAALDLSGCGVGREGANALASSPHPAKLKTLILRANNLWGGEVALLVRSRHVARLARLDLSDNHLGKVSRSGVNALLASPHLAGLCHLDLTGNGLDADDRDALQKHFGSVVRC